MNATATARRALGVVAAVLLMTGLAVPASADPQDDVFLFLVANEDGWHYDLMASDGTGGGLHRIVDRPVVGRPAMSPDGSMVAFTSALEPETLGRFALWTVGINGNNLVQLTNPSKGHFDPAWSPDGEWIAYSKVTPTLRRATCCGIWVIRPDGSGRTMIDGTEGGVNPSWSPDGSQIAYERPDGVFVIPAGGGSPTKIAGTFSQQPAWSPDGGTLAYVKWLVDDWALRVRQPVAGSEWENLVEMNDSIESPTWDPSGGFLYYVRHKGVGYEGRSSSSIWTVDMNGDTDKLFGVPGEIVLLAHRRTEADQRCDFDGDGFGDLAASAPGETVAGSNNAGLVNVLYGAVGHLVGVGAQAWDQGDNGIPGQPGDGKGMGSALACGDFDGDGRDDLAAGLPGDNAGAGSVVVIYGAGAGLTGGGSQLWDQDSPGVPDSAEPGDGFGSALVAADFDGDGRDDLAVGVPGESNNVHSGMGLVNVLYGSSDGVTAQDADQWTRGTPDVAGMNGTDFGFGSALTAGDFDGDDLADLAVGVPGADPDDELGAGEVNVIYGSNSGLSVAGDQRWSLASTGVPRDPAEGDGFGSAIVAADLDRDGRADLAIGVPGESNAKGSVVVLEGSSAGLSAGAGQRWTQDTGLKGSATAGDRFGDALTAGDFDRNGFVDLAVGVPGKLENGGSVNVIYSSSNGLIKAGNKHIKQSSSGIKGRIEAGDLFGSALWAADFDGDSYIDVAIGVPGEDGTRGAVAVIYGKAGGLGKRDQLWQQGSAGVPGSASQGDGFGAVLPR